MRFIRILAQKLTLTGDSSLYQAEMGLIRAPVSSDGEKLLDWTDDPVQIHFEGYCMIY